ncbi:MAG: MerR family transcriptional regulator [Atopobiaceae bacterium]|nr:MerR family transcriptional regulator [Atopobiaceae bacterium]
MGSSGQLTIGKVVARLQDQYPDLSVSKIRFLEDEGLLTPSRTPGGYRLYSSRDIKRLETILYLLKTRYLPLNVFREQLEREGGNDLMGISSGVGADYDPSTAEDDEQLSKLHDIENLPDMLGVSVSFVRQMADVGLIELKRSPHGRDLIEGREIPIIRTAAELRRFGVEPKNLRQYVTAANRESAMFEQALAPLTARAQDNDENAQAQLQQVFERMLSLTNTLRSSLLRKVVRGNFKGIDV